MPLFLSEDTLYKYLLREAGDDEETSEPTSDDTEKDKGDVGADTKDSGADSADTETDKGDEPPTDDSEPPESDPPGDDPAPVGGDEPPTAPKRKPSKFAIKVEDTPQNRLYLFKKFEEITALHSSLKQFIENIFTSANLSDKQKKLLEQLREKVNVNLQMLEQLSDDELYTSLDISDVFGLYKIYYNDVKNVNVVIRSLMRVDDKKNDRKG